jgi:hypothetical protein
LVARLLGVQEVVSSNLTAPTISIGVWSRIGDGRKQGVIETLSMQKGKKAKAEMKDKAESRN